MSVLDDATIIYVPGVYKTSAVALQKPISAGSVSSLTFARASTATRVNSSGLIESVATNVPRVDFLNGSCGAQILEPARTNLLTYSEQFDNAAWTNPNVTISANAEVAPDDTMTADKLIDNGTNGSHYLSQPISVTSGFDYVITWFVKADDLDYVLIYANGQGTYFNVANGTVLGNQGTSPQSSSITEYKNGYYRCEIIINSTVTGSTNAQIYLSQDGSSFSYSGSSRGVYIWGAQVEAGSYPTSYIKTEALIVTRAAETLSKTGLSEIGVNQGSLFLHLSQEQITRDSPAVFFTLGAVGNRIYIYNDGASSQFVGVLIEDGSGTSYVLTTSSNSKIGIVYSAGSVKVFENGNLIGDFARTLDFTGVQNISITGANRRIGLGGLSLWDIALTDTELENLTT